MCGSRRSGRSAQDRSTSATSRSARRRPRSSVSARSGPPLRLRRDPYPGLTTTRPAAALLPPTALDAIRAGAVPALVGFGAVFGLSAVNGGFFPTSWGWAPLSLLLLAAAALIVRDAVLL